MMYLSIVNWEKFQHYKDRRPPWIKLHAEVLDDYAFLRLSDATKAHLMLLWVLAGKLDNKIPYDIDFIGGKIGATSRIDFDALVFHGFVAVGPDDDKKVGRLEGWASRYVSAQTRTALLSASHSMCSACRSTEKLEIDHIIPISQGGTGDIKNLQVLCRQCNRRKRVQSAEHLRSKPLHTVSGSALPEAEAEAEAERESEKETESRAPRERKSGGGWPARFAVSWTAATNGDISVGRIGRALKDLVDRVGEDPAHAAWLIFLESDKHQFGPTYFAEHYGDFDPLTPGQLWGVGTGIPTSAQLASIGIKWP